MFHPRKPFAPSFLPSMLAALCIGLAAVPAWAGDRAATGPLTQPTPGYVEERQGLGGRIETADTRRPTRWARSASGRTAIVGLNPTTPEARRRADRFMQTWHPPARMRLQGSSDGTIGIAIDF